MNKKLLIIIICLLCCACDSKKETINFKKEYEKYNEKYIKLNLSNANIIKYSNKEEINKIIKNKTGVIYIGSPKDNLSRKAIEILLEAADNTGLDKIYYINNLDNIEGLEEIEKKEIPLILFVLKGEIVKYHQGTINNNEKLSEDETIELYNTYIDGIHKVLQDACDDEC